MTITTKILKGSALLEESRRLVEVWDPTESSEENLDRIRTSNLLGKTSRSRTADAMDILRQRLIDTDGEVLGALRALTANAEGFRDACYYEAARNDDLLAYLSGTLLYSWYWDRGRSSAPSDDVHDELLSDPPEPKVTDWSAGTSMRVVRSALSALRTFGVLEGTVNKRIASPHLSFPGFLYVLGRLRTVPDLPVSGIVNHAVWRWWLLDDRLVRGHFLEADRAGLLRFSEAGSTVRIDWQVNGLEAMVRAAV